YHIGLCLGPCARDVSQEEVRRRVEGIEHFLKGGYQKIKQQLTGDMEEAALQMNYERAKNFRDQIRHIETVMEKQKMTLNDFTDRDVFGYSYDKGWMCVQVFFIRQGKLIERDVSLFPIYGDPEAGFLTYIGQFY